ncbi:MAG: tetratricopeptide repeat protein [Moorea sp. SIOASIH]|uniref:LicD family protein n=1 Tax=Moorena sp. SIOASIH TaxID=2607817 RepID=UPI0013BB2E27|nr:LicD family protein [Moorena sp. SIOASIH]NEO40959.1 tetratricopeptide repeat protein [Moorena sp. SIOASIH]
MQKRLQERTKIKDKLINLPDHLAQAIANTHKNIELQPDNPQLYLELAELYCQQGEWVESIACYLKGIKIKPDCEQFHEQLWYLLLSAQISLQRLEEIDRCARQVIQAATMYQQSLALESDVLSAQPHEALTTQEGLAEAIAHYNYAIENGIESKKTGTIADMVVALAQKLKPIHWQLRQDFQFLDSLLRQHHIPYWAISGTLIGALRHEGVIPWDDDIDIEMTEADFQKLFTLKTLLNDHGFYFRKIEKNLYKISDGIDIYIYDQRRLPSEGGNPQYPDLDEIFPLREFQFYDFKIYGPNQAETYLKRGYGQEVLKVCRIWNHRLNVALGPDHDPKLYSLSTKKVKIILNLA